MKIKVGSRKSPLAQAQAKQVADQLVAAQPDAEIEWVWITTTGDRIRDRPLRQAGGKGLFLKEIEQALTTGEIDMAIHSGKDVTTTLPAGLQLSATPKRGVYHDVLCVPAAAADDPRAFRGTVGTGSDRRAFQFRELCPNADVVGLRGNIGTRLGKVSDGSLDGVIIAAAGLARLDVGWTGQVQALESFMLPAVGQGTLAIETRADDSALVKLLQSIHHADTWGGYMCERAALRAVEGDCFTPFGALASRKGDSWRLRAALWSDDGRQRWSVDLQGTDPEALGDAAGRELLSQRVS